MKLSHLVLFGLSLLVACGDGSGRPTAVRRSPCGTTRPLTSRVASTRQGRR